MKGLPWRSSGYVRRGRVVVFTGHVVVVADARVLLLPGALGGAGRRRGFCWGLGQLLRAGHRHTGSGGGQRGGTRSGVSSEAGEGGRPIGQLDPVDWGEGPLGPGEAAQPRAVLCMTEPGVTHPDRVNSLGFLNSKITGHPLAVQWLSLHTLTAEGLGSTPGRGTKILQAMWQPKIRGREASRL